MRINEAAWLDKYNRWQIKVQKEGVRKTFTSSTPGKKGKIECEKKADKWLEKGIFNDNIRLGEAYKLYLDYTLKINSYSTWQKCENIGRNWLLPDLEHKKISQITIVQWQNCLDKCCNMGRSKKTISNIRGCITAFVSFSKKMGWEVKDATDLKVPKHAPTGERLILQPDDLKRLFSTNSDDWYINAYKFIALTGLRRGELCGLQNDDIKDDVLYVKRAVNERLEITDGKTKNSKRYFILCDKAKEILVCQKTMLKQHGIISPYLFPAKNGSISSPNTLYNHWSKFRKTIGVNCSLHELRHTLISYASSNVPELLLKRAVGHSKSMDTFNVYSHRIDGEMQRVADGLNETFSKILK